MERYTIRSSTGIRIKGCRTVYGNVERNGANVNNAIVRLAEYEDSGLTPQEIIPKNNNMAEKAKWTDTYKNGYKPINCIICSRCDKVSGRRTKYCPNCGAKMDL